MATGTLTNSPSPWQHSAFTLLELLVVIVIIGILTTFATYAIDTSSDLVFEAERFAAISTLVQDEAILQAKEYSLVMEPDGYRFQVYKDNEWHDLEQDEIFKPRKIPDSMTLTINIEGEHLDLSSTSDFSDHEQETTKIFFFSSGEFSPFTILFKHKSSKMDYSVAGDPGAGIKVSRVTSP